MGQAASIAPSLWGEPTAISIQQSIFVFWQLITGKDRNMLICDQFDPIYQQVGTLLGPFSDDKGQCQTPGGCKGNPDPGIPIAFIIDFRQREVIFFGVNKTS
jgi:hypothetical protein